MAEVTVAGPGVSPYQVRIGRGLLGQAGPAVAPLLAGPKAVVVSDATVAGLYAPALLASLKVAGVAADLVAVPAGEGSKSFAELERVLDRLAALGLDRSGAVIALGGGVVGDLAGLAAALHMRGVDFIQIPTTLLAQVDSSVGGKTAIDTPRGKNLVGAFHHPRLVLADIDLLASLPPRQLRSGWAEVLKHGLICDPDFFDWLAGEGAAGAAGEGAALAGAVERSVRIKAAIVAEDPREAGRRALLNLGHTFGHAFEAETGFDARLTHGEAVALGCVLAFRFSVVRGLCPAAEADRVTAAIAAAGLPTTPVEVGDFSAAALVERMAGDKKARGGELALVLARGVGRAELVRGVDPAEVGAFLIDQGARA